MHSQRRQDNLDLIRKAVARRRVEGDFRPFHAFLEISTYCNIRCIQCNRCYDEEYLQGRRQGNITMETVRSLAGVLPHIRNLSATGFGEPFMNPRLLEILDYLRGFGVNLSMISNGVLLGEERARALVEMGLDEIWFSMDSPERDTFESIRVGADFQRVTDNIARLARFREEAGGSGPRIALEFVAMAPNFLHLPDMPALARRLGAYKIVVQKLFNSPDRRYQEFYKANCLGNVELQPGLEAWRLFQERARAAGLQVESYLGDDPSPLFKADTSASAGAGREYPPFYGCLDRPGPFTSHLGTLSLGGWIQGQKEIPRARVCLARGERVHTWPLALEVERPDVVAALPDAFRDDPRCGFVADLDLAGLEPGTWSLYLQAINAGEEGAERLSERQVYVNQERDLAMYCTQPWSTIFVTWQGEVKTCCFSDLVLGRLADRDIEEIWTGGSYTGLRRMVVDGRVHPKCVDCVRSGYPVNYIPGIVNDGQGRFVAGD